MAAHIAGEGTHLQRYARHLTGAEINSSFYRPHGASTYARWADATPSGFRFSVKLPRAITHDQRLRRVRLLLQRFLAESSGLGERRGPVLVQLPPSLPFESRVAARFFTLLRDMHDGPVVCEPRHATWFTPPADALLARHLVSRVAADPAVVPLAGQPGGWTGLVYYRLHGSPRMYWSRYDDDVIERLTSALQALPADTEVWCIFDNTATGAALENAWALQQQLAAR